MNLTDRSKLRRLPNRGSHDAETIHAILDAAFVAHVGFAIDGQPFVVPMLYGREGERLFLHGSPASRLIRELGNGVPACVTVTLLDGLVLARSAFHHSLNYRSVMAFGTARTIDDPPAKNAALRVISEHMMRERWEQVREPNPAELKATAVLEFIIEETSAKLRTGPPADDEADYDLPVWAGVLPLEMRAGPPAPDARLKPGVTVPAYVAEYGNGSK